MKWLLNTIWKAFVKAVYFAWRILPILFRFFFFSLTWMLKCMAAQFRGIPGAVDQIAREWTRNAIINSRIPLEFEKYIYRVMVIASWAMILFGYILAAHLVVLVFWWIF